jgi:hypothetical protein
MKRLSLLVLIALFAVISSAQLAQEDVPAYHSKPPAKGEKLPPILSGKQLQSPTFQFPAQVKVYKEAAKISPVLYQLPCYCHCDRSAGHTSLHSCFESEHGAHCGICMREAVLAAQMTKQKKTPKQIRDAIIRGDYERVNLQSATD